MRHILGNDLFASVIISGEPLWIFSDIPTSNRYQNWSIGWKPMRFFLRKYRVNIGFWKKIPPPDIRYSDINRYAISVYADTHGYVLRFGLLGVKYREIVGEKKKKTEITVRGPISTALAGRRGYDNGCLRSTRRTKKPRETADRVGRRYSGWRDGMRVRFALRHGGGGE